MYICICDVEIYQPYSGLDQLAICGERSIKQIKCYIDFSESIDIISGDVVYEPRVLLGDIEAIESVKLNND